MRLTGHIASLDMLLNQNRPSGFKQDDTKAFQECLHSDRIIYKIR